MIPKHFHFIYLYGVETYPFALSHYLSCKSNIIVNGLHIGDVTVWTNNIDRLQSEYYFKKLCKEFPGIELIDVNTHLPFDLTRFKGKDIRYMSHQADILKNWIISTYGGVYSDFDSIALKPMPGYWYKSDKTIMCTEDVNGFPSALCAGFFLGVKDCPLLKATLDRYQYYDPDEVKPKTSKWAHFAVVEPFNIYLQHLDWIEVVSAKYFEPLYIDYDSVQAEFFIDRSDLIKDSYQLHLWENRNGHILRTMKESAILNIESTYTKAVRKFLK
jgi:hypothetical protein